jgi:hypothetical protein
MFIQIWQIAPQALFNRCSNLQLVNGSHKIPKVQNDNLSLALFRTLEEHGHNIKEFEFSQGTIKSDQLLEMPTVMGRLTTITIRSGHFNKFHFGKDTGSDPELVPSMMQTLGSLCSSLRHLDLRQYDNLYKDDLEVLLFGLRGSLVSLKVGDWSGQGRDELLIGHSPFKNCTLLEKLMVYDGGDAEDVKAICRLGNLKELAFVKMDEFKDDFDFGDENEEDEDGITDKDFQQAFDQKQLINLHTFDLSGHRKFGRRATAALLQNCPNLTRWSCNEIGQIEGLVRMVQDFGPREIKLKKLHVNMTLDKNELMVVTSLRNLDELHMCGERLTGQDYRDAFKRGSLVNLQVLNLTDCHNLDNEGLKAVLKGSPKLRKILLYPLPKVAGFGDIFADCNLKHLDTVSFPFDCPNFRDHHVNVLKRSCPKLKKIFVNQIDY